jgi:2'-hydroxyisoflavone reductase
MKILLIGGTGFVGRHICTELLKNGHKVTLFNRGRTEKELFPECERIVGDRDISHEALMGHTWDAAIDTNGRMPSVVKEAARLLRKQVGHYSFISSISAYEALQPNSLDHPKTINETSKLATITSSEIDDTSMRTYGKRKARCEADILEVWHDKALISRPGLIVGPWDTTDRFTYWPVRIHEGGDIICPGTGDDEVRFIDVRDLAMWHVKMIEEGKHGTFNLTGPAKKLTIKELVKTGVRLINPSSKIIWASQAFLQKHSVSAWSDMPVWAPAMTTIDSSKAVASGLKFRPLADTIVDTFKWAESQDMKRPLKAGLTKQREDNLIKSIKESAEV